MAAREFEEPPENGSPDRDSDEDSAIFAMADINSGLRQAKDELEALLFARPEFFAEIAALALDDGAPPDPMDIITGVGIGPAHRDFKSVGPESGARCSMFTSPNP